MKERYYLYWLNPDKTRTLVSEKEYETYQDLYSARLGLVPPIEGAKLQFGVIKL